MQYIVEIRKTYLLLNILLSVLCSNNICMHKEIGITTCREYLKHMSAAWKSNKGRASTDYQLFFTDSTDAYCFPGKKQKKVIKEMFTTFKMMFPIN